MHDKFRKKYRLPAATERLRQQIALEAARRLLDGAEHQDTTSTLDWLDRTGENDFYVAKRKAAAVLGHRVRPGDLPSDGEVRDQLVTLWRSRRDQSDAGELPRCPSPLRAKAWLHWPSTSTGSPSTGCGCFPWKPSSRTRSSIPRATPSITAFRFFIWHARRGRMTKSSCSLPLLHDVGKAVDALNHAEAGAEAVRGAVTERTLWLIAHHMDLFVSRERTLRRGFDASSRPPNTSRI